MYLWLLNDDVLTHIHHKEKYIKDTYPEIYKEFKSIKFPENLPFSQLFWHFLHNDLQLQLGLCPICKKRCKFRFSTYGGYRKHCSQECLSKDKNALNDRGNKIHMAFENMSDEKSKERVRHIQNTLTEKYGVINYSQTQDFKEKIKNTWKNKTDDELNEIHKKQFKAKLEKYGDGNYNNGEKISKTLLAHDELFWKERIEKIQSTSMMRYGEKFYMQTDEYKNRIQNTWMNKPQEEIDNMVKKVKETSEERYGVPNYTMTQVYKDKMQQICMEKYGVKYYFQTQEYKDKMQQTCLEKYGVKNYSQTQEWASRKQKKLLYDDLYFDSSWEVIVYKYCKENNIDCIYQPDITFEYEYDGKKHFYHPDFLINNQLYEVKGDQFFDGDKMICPYNRDKYKDELSEAKHQCMLKNNVIILRNADIEIIKGML